jgi:protein kinase-like protein
MENPRVSCRVTTFLRYHPKGRRATNREFSSVTRPWEKALPFVALVILGLLIAQVLYLHEDFVEGQIYLHTVPAGAEIFMPQAGSVAGFNKKFLGRSPGPLPISIKERTRFTFNLELWGFEDKRVYVRTDELAAGPTYALKPKWGLASFLFYNLRDYVFCWLALILPPLFWFFWVRPQQRKKQAQAALWDSGKLQTGMQFHEYRLLDLLGEGAAGAVYLADKPAERSKERYTLKIFHRGQGKEDKDLETALSREFQNSAELSHPNIVYLLDWGIHRGYYYLVSEYVNGAPLDEISDFTLSDVCNWGHQLVGALSYAHSCLVVHRDIKPANILRTADDRVKVLDFGIAARTDGEEESGAGSIGYMAPEQASGAVTPASDYYSLGVTVYRLASGKMPFQGDDYFQVLASQATGRYKSLRSVVSDCPEALDELVNGLLQKEPEQRLQDPDQIRMLFEKAESQLMS